MNSRISHAIIELSSIRNRYTEASSSHKENLLEKLNKASIKDPKQLGLLHATLCFLRAFPDNEQVLALVNKLLASYKKRIAKLTKSSKEELTDSGIEGTELCCVYSFEIALWLAKNFPELVDIDWDTYEEPENLIELLLHLVSSAEEQTFVDEEQIAFGEELTARRWIEFAKGQSTASSLTWLMHQFPKNTSLNHFWSHLYDNADVPICWKLSGNHSSITNNQIRVRKPNFRSSGLRHFAGSAEKLVSTPLTGEKLLSRKEATEAIDTGISMLASRHREVYSLRYPNPEEVYRVPLGEGADVILVGLRNGYRMSIEANYTFYITANGVPIGYGGVTSLFSQANTGISVFPEFRGGESAALFAQSLRAFHSLLGCTRFVVNPYQIGEGNDDALTSGAYWFYYKLGFRPTAKEHRDMASKLYERLRKSRNAKINPSIITKLTSQPIHLRLQGDKASHYFDERWLGTIAVGATQLIASQGELKRQTAIQKIVDNVCSSLGTRSLKRWPINEQKAFIDLSPVVGLLPNLKSWNSSEKRTLVTLMRAKGKPCEKEFATRLREHNRFRQALLSYCRAQRRKGALV